MIIKKKKKKNDDDRQLLSIKDHMVSIMYAPVAFYNGGIFSICVEKCATKTFYKLPHVLHRVLIECVEQFRMKYNFFS